MVGRLLERVQLAMVERIGVDHGKADGWGMGVHVSGDRVTVAEHGGGEE